MIKKIASLLLGLSSVAQPLDAHVDKAVSANSDVWMVYDRVASDGRPLVIVTRTGNASARILLLNGLTTVVTCRSDPTNVNEQEMPQGTERLYPMEDKLDQEPALLAAGAIRIASVTGQGERRMFIVHRDPFDFSPLLRTTEVQGFSCHASEVSDRQSLINLITPTPLETQLNGDQDVIANLRKNGDDGHAPRKTDFWFYGQQESLDALFANLRGYGFSVDHRLSDRTGIVLSRKMPVDLAAFQELTPVVVDAAERAGVDYDGWETMVVSQALSRTDGRGDH